MSDTEGDARRRELGENSGPVEEEVEESFDRTVEEGAQRLNRSFRDVLITGLFGGFEIGIGIMAYLGVLHETGSHLLAGLAFSAGLIALLLAKSELFTEGFLVPIAAVIAREASYAQLGKLWGGTLIANLVGGWLFMALIMTAFPQWSETITTAANHFLDAGFNWETVCLAVLGGSTITLMTRMQHGTDSVTGKIAAAVVGAFLLAGMQLFHSILDSLLIFGAIHAGAEINYLEWLGWFSYVVVFNVLGGIVLVTALRLVSASKLVKERRDDAPENPEDAHHSG
ncbi:formate/nitrite transporter family protein [Crystallibacter degradans]|uniref:formate/nitrite transporter family protein n=1 Tax=Crystallibacter degradans TaxID=2726743 RepID=UPI00147380DF|nr:formate/nitrite transporter family protein [Arthrobacter sp. SF27]NMR28115.1 formate/nitrite transporter family protein [Arthrobacter sp. SF27]